VRGRQGWLAVRVTAALTLRVTVNRPLVSDMAQGEPRPFLHRVGSAGANVATLQPSHRGLRIAVAIGVPAIILVSLAVAIATQWSKLPSFHWRFQPGWFVLSLAAFAVFQLAQAQLWVAMMHALGAPLDGSRGRAIWCMTLLGRYVPTSVMMPISRMALAQREGVPGRVSLASFVYEMGLTFTAAVVVGVYFFLELPALQDEPLRFAALAIPLIAIVALDPRVFHRLADYGLQRLGRQPLPLSLSRGRVLGFLFLYALTMVIAGIGTYSLAHAVHAVDDAQIATCVAAFSVGYAASLIAFILPGGLGAREAALAGALAPVLPFTVAGAVAVAVRLEQMVVEVAFAFITPMLAKRATGRGIRLDAPPESSGQEAV
jgi:glycosyltransferase 2 family protein